MIKSITYKQERLRKNLVTKRLVDNMFSLAEVAKQTGISKATLSRIENGKLCDMETFAKLCQWFGTEPNDYFEIVKERQDGFRK